MTGADAAARYAAHYQPSSEELRKGLLEMGERLRAQCEDLWRAPTPERAERLSLELECARRVTLSYRERLIAEGEGHGQ